MRLKLFSAALLVTSISHALPPIDGWYSSVFGGYTYLPDHIRIYPEKGVFINNATFSSGYNAGARVGYQSNPLRYELEYTYLNADVRYFEVNLIGQIGSSGYSTANLAMFNAYFDTPEILPAIKPFIGFGLGYAYLQDRLSSETFLGNTIISLNENAFAVQGTVGLTYNFSEYYALNIAYRYISTTSSDTDLGLRYQAQTANAGVVYRFDYGTYK